MLVEPRCELLPELSIDPLSDTQVEEMNPDQALPQMPPPHGPHAAKDNRSNEDGPRAERKGVSRTPNDGQ